MPENQTTEQITIRADVSAFAKVKLAARDASQSIKRDWGSVATEIKQAKTALDDFIKTSRAQAQRMRQQRPFFDSLSIEKERVGGLGGHLSMLASMRGGSGLAPGAYRGLRPQHPSPAAALASSARQDRESRGEKSALQAIAKGMEKLGRLAGAVQMVQSQQQRMGGLEAVGSAAGPQNIRSGLESAGEYGSIRAYVATAAAQSFRARSGALESVGEAGALHEINMRSEVARVEAQEAAGGALGIGPPVSSTGGGGGGAMLMAGRASAIAYAVYRVGKAFVSATTADPVNPFESAEEQRIYNEYQKFQRTRQRQTPFVSGLTARRFLPMSLAHGFELNEAVNLIGMAGQAAGVRLPGGIQNDLLRLERAGVGVSGAGGLLRPFAVGGGAAGGEAAMRRTLASVFETSVRQGMDAAQITQYMESMGSFYSSLGSRGIDFDPARLGAFIGGLSEVNPALGGMRALSAVGSAQQGLSQVARGGGSNLGQVFAYAAASEFMGRELGWGESIYAIEKMMGSPEGIRAFAGQYTRGSRSLDEAGILFARDTGASSATLAREFLRAVMYAGEDPFAVSERLGISLGPSLVSGSVVMQEGARSRRVLRGAQWEAAEGGDWLAGIHEAFSNTEMEAGQLQATVTSVGAAFSGLTEILARVVNVTADVLGVGPGGAAVVPSLPTPNQD